MPMVHSNHMVEEVYAEELIAQRLAVVRRRIADAARRAGRDPGSVTLVAVTKTMSTSTIRAAALAGIADIGENRVQEAIAKAAELQDLRQVRWHLIGHLQRNKARRAVETFSVIQSLDSLQLAATVSGCAAERGLSIEAFAQVKVSGEAGKYGFTPIEFRRQAAALAKLPALRWRGLMTIAPYSADEALIRAVFAGTRRLHREAAGDFDPTAWDALSMGMTNDFELAIEEGATHVRVGRAIFGERTEVVRA